jgi:hypothetical protein
MPTVIPSLIYILDSVVEKQRILRCAMRHSRGADHIKAGVICRAKMPGMIRHYIWRSTGKPFTAGACAVGQM